VRAIGNGGSRVDVGGRVPRRRVLAGAGAALASAVLGREAAAGPATPAAAAARTVAHRYGATEVAGMPARVVTVGLTEQDYALALGVAPVGAREWFGGQPGALWPWARAAAGDAPLPAVLPVDALNFEQIAALAPDLILGVNSGMTEEEYATLAAIAPTVAQPPGVADYGATWQEMTQTIGLALGREAAAAALIPALEQQFAAARAAHPAFAGATALLAAVTTDGGVWIYAEGPAPSFLAALGFALPEAAAALFAGENRPPVQLSPERFDVLEADVLVVGLYGPAGSNLAENPVYRGLRVAREGRDVVLDGWGLDNAAMTFGSVLSLPAALDAVVPRLAAALDGDPATSVV
jgi:iron complex transport system substrate-binding protein